MSADQILASLSVDQLNRGLVKAKQALEMLDALEQEEPAFDGPFPPSKSYERWSANDFAERRRLYEIGMADVTRELLRREHLSSLNEGEQPK
jgi:hypothetical protein